MPLITLTSDYGITDHYIAAIKGYLFSNIEDLHIVDISNTIEPFNLPQAAYTFKNAFEYFPENTIHICHVDASQYHTNRFILVKHNSQFFIGPDNGLFSLVWKDWPQNWISIRKPEQTKSNLDPILDILAPTAVKLIQNGYDTIQCGLPTKNAVLLSEFQAVPFQTQLQGIIIHIDNYGNIITNISKLEFEAFIENQDFEIRFRSGDTIRKISRSYSDVPEGESLALFNTNDMLEIGIYADRASSLLGLRKGESISVFKH